MPHAWKEINLTTWVYRSGTIKRSKLDKSEPTISYEHFVEDLDIGDSFTTSVIEILVKVRYAIVLAPKRWPNIMCRNSQNAALAR